MLSELLKKDIEEKITDTVLNCCISTVLQKSKYNVLIVGFICFHQCSLIIRKSNDLKNNNEFDQ